MDENNGTEQQQQDPATGDRPSGWFAFAEKPVMLQLKSPYIGCTYAYKALRSEDGDGFVAAPILSGILHVEPSGNGGIMLVLQMPMAGNDFTLIALNIDMIEYCSHIHQPRIIT